jgi:LSD1 subclass zinc finger protein
VFVKQVECARCGAPKRLPSKTAYLYCDNCGSLVDYDFRLANSGTNAGLTNTVYHQLVAPLQLELTSARAVGDADRYRELMRGVYAEWIRQCPEAVSPRARTDEDFRDRMVGYLAECTVRKDLDVTLAPLDRSLNAATGALKRFPTADGAWLVSDGIWQVAAEFKQLMEKTYQMLDVTGVLAMDPDEAPPGVPLRMEYSTFCQGWIPHLRPADAERLLAIYGLTGKYARVNVTDAVTRKCGGCGDELKTLPGASAVVCESCGRKLDIAGGETPCQTCGAPLSFPVGTSRLECPYCHSETHRI